MSESESEEIIIGPQEKKYGIITGILYGVGCGIGGSIFILLGIGIDVAGPGVLISLILGGILILFIALNYSELSTSLPISGGAYNFSKEAVGGFSAFIIGFLLWIANIATCSFSAQALTLIIIIFFPFLNNFLFLIMISVFSVLLISLVFFRTQRFAIRTLLILTLVLIVIFSIFIIAGLIISPITNPIGYNPNYLNTSTSFYGVIYMFAFLFIFFTSITQNLAYFNAGLKKPSKNIPIVNILAIMLTLIIYLSITFVVLINIGNKKEGLSHSPLLLGEILYNIIGPVGFYLMGFAAIISILIAMNASLGSAVSVFQALSRDHYFPKIFNEVSKKSNVPIYSLIITTIVVIIFTFLAVIYANIGFTAEITSFTFLLGLAFINLTAINLRYKRKALDRPFKAPFFPFLPIIVTITCLILALFVLEPAAIFLGLIIFAIAILYYLLTIVDRYSLVMTLAGIKILCVIIVGFSIWIINNVTIISVTISGLDTLFSRFLLRILIIICIISIGTIVLDIIPLREFVFFFTRKLDKKKVAIDLGFGQIIELDKTKVKIIYRINFIIAVIQMLSAIYIFFLVYLFGMGYISLEKIVISGIIIRQTMAEYLIISNLILFGFTLLVSGGLMIYISREVLALGM
ncbi:MAG: amino acid permease [Promethearchaeota archaeon]|nr:MAG: amino acid permease [Candidatus Lokiarchaeota archaeon]